MDVKTVINNIIALYERLGSADYIGEKVSQYQHALQSAMCAMNDKELIHYDEFTRNCVIVAAFSHDIGHLIGMDKGKKEMLDGTGKSLGVVSHEQIGAEYLKEIGFPSLVSHLVKNHVNSKRYLCSVNSAYRGNVSAASLSTLQLQGGLMSEDEIKKFRGIEALQLCIKIRLYDDDAKKVNFFTEASFNENLDKVIDIMKKLLVLGKIFI